VTGRARVGRRTADVVRTIDLAGEIVPVKVGVASQLIVNCRMRSGCGTVLCHRPTNKFVAGQSLLFSGSW
jgi:hypothetical protein